MRMTNIDVSIIIVNYDITSLVVNAIDSLFHKIKDLTIEIIVISNVSNDMGGAGPAPARPGKKNFYLFFFFFFILFFFFFF